MGKRLRQFQGWFDDRPRRERMLLLGAVLAVVVLLWNFLALAPLEERHRSARAAIEDHTHNLSALENDREALLARRDSNPEAELQQKLERIEDRSQALQTELDAEMERLVPPREMVRVLRQLLEGDDVLTLVRLETSAPEVVHDSDDLRIYRHRVLVEFEGNYAGTRRYLQELESGSRKLGWESIDYEVQEHPKARVRLRVYTLSPDEPTLGI